MKKLLPNFPMPFSNCVNIEIEGGESREVARCRLRASPTTI